MVEDWSLVANPVSGNGAGRRIAERAAKMLRADGRPVSLHFTRSKGHAEELARSLVDGGCRRLVVCGGDGTLNEVVASLAHREVEMGLLPCGTGNDFARALGIPLRWRAALQTLKTGQPQSFDLGRVGDRYFCTVAAFGFDAHVSQAVNDRRDRFSLTRSLRAGTSGYLLATLQQLSRYRPQSVRLAGDFGRIEGRYLLVAAGNTRSYGGGMRIVPTADPRDGILEICIVEALSKATLIAVLPRVFSGGHINHPAVRIERSTWLNIEPSQPEMVHADGEYACQAPATVECVPQAIRVVVPAPRTPP